MKWFKHDTDATNDPKIRKLKKQFGMEGYGLYFNLLELIARDMEDRPDDFGFLPKDWDNEALEMETGISSDKLRTITDFMCEIGLFCQKDKRLYNSKIIERCDDYTSRILRNKAQNTKSTNIVRTKSDKVPLDKIRIDKNNIESANADLVYEPLKDKSPRAFLNRAREKTGRPPMLKKNPGVMRIIEKYCAQYKYITGKRAIVSDADYFHVLSITKKMSPEDMEAMIIWYIKMENKKFMDHPGLKSIFTVENVLKFNNQK